MEEGFIIACDQGTRYSSAGFIDEANAVHLLTFAGKTSEGSGVHVSDDAIDELKTRGLLHFSLEECKKKMTPEEARTFFVDIMYSRCVVGNEEELPDNNSIRGFKYDLPNPPAYKVSNPDPAYHRMRKEQEDGSVCFELTGDSGDTVWVYPSALVTLMAVHQLTRLVETAEEAGYDFPVDDNGDPVYDAKIKKLVATVPNEYAQPTKDVIRQCYSALGIASDKISFLTESVAASTGAAHSSAWARPFHELLEGANGSPCRFALSDCGSQTNDVSTFEATMDGAQQLGMVNDCYGNNRAGGDFPTGKLKEAILAEYRRLRNIAADQELPYGTLDAAHRLAEKFKVGPMGSSQLKEFRSSPQYKVLHAAEGSEELVSLGRLEGVEIKVRASVVRKIFTDFVYEIRQPVIDMLARLPDVKPLDAFLFTSGAARSAAMSSLLEQALRGDGHLRQGGLFLKDQVNLLLVRGALFHGAAECGKTEVLQDGRPIKLLDVTTADRLPGDVYVKDDSDEGYTQVFRAFARPGEPGARHVWRNQPHQDESLVLICKLASINNPFDDRYAAPFGVRLPQRLRGRAFWGELKYTGNGQIDLQVYPLCCFREDAAGHKVRCEGVPAPDWPAWTFSLEAFTRRQNKYGVRDTVYKLIEFLEKHAPTGSLAAQASYQDQLAKLKAKLKQDAQRQIHALPSKTDGALERDEYDAIGTVATTLLERILEFSADHGVPMETDSVHSQLAPPQVSMRRYPTRATSATASTATASGGGGGASQRQQQPPPQVAVGVTIAGGGGGGGGGSSSQQHKTSLAASSSSGGGGSGGSGIQQKKKKSKAKESRPPLPPILTNATSSGSGSGGGMAAASIPKRTRPASGGGGDDDVRPPNDPTTPKRQHDSL